MKLAGSSDNGEIDMCYGIFNVCFVCATMMRDDYVSSERLIGILDIEASCCVSLR